MKKDLSEKGTFRLPLSMIPLCLLSLVLIGTLALTLSSCNELTPYTRPSMAIPSSYRDATGQTAKESAEAVKEYLGQLFWWDFLTDDVLKDLVATAVVQNYDLRLAAERIIEAQARVGIARASQFPTVNASGGYQTVQVSTVGATPMPPGTSNTTYTFNIGLLANYEVDFWGRYRYATAAARANLLATEEGKNIVLMTLVSEVASTYMQIRELDLELEISKKTLESRQESLTLVTARAEGGVATNLDVDQAKVLVIGAQKTITEIEQQIAQQEDYLSYLLGKNPGGIPRGKTLPDQFTGEPIPPGLPSSLLESRPDIRQAELVLLAYNAQIGAARAAYFPQITLTGGAGTLSKELSNLFTPPSYTWNFAASVLQPIFNAGQIRSQVAVTESQKRQAVISYEKTVQGAFKEVSDALIGYQKGTQYYKQQDEYTKTLADQSYLANLRYAGGVSSYLEVLDTERQYFEAELDLSKAQLNVYLYIVKLYKSLGGGWQQKPAAEQRKPMAEQQKPAAEKQQQNPDKSK
jgi:outer membrane protein, multidrug efflux system